MKIKKLTIIITIIFTAIMLVLTFTARDIRNYYLLPNVWVERLKNEQMESSFFLDDGTEVYSSYSKLAISKELFDSMEGVYVIENRVVNNEKRTFLKQVFISFNGENETFYFIENGITQSDLLVTKTSLPLSNGIEVFIRSY